MMGFSMEEAVVMVGGGGGVTGGDHCGRGRGTEGWRCSLERRVFLSPPPFAVVMHCNVFRQAGRLKARRSPAHPAIDLQAIKVSVFSSLHPAASVRVDVCVCARVVV